MEKEGQQEEKGDFLVYNLTKESVEHRVVVVDMSALFLDGSFPSLLLAADLMSNARHYARPVRRRSRRTPVSTLHFLHNHTTDSLPCTHTPV